MAMWRLVAGASNILALFAFGRLPWAAGAGPLAERHFNGPGLARLAHNADVLLGDAHALAAALSLALWATPIALIAALVLLIGARWTNSPVLASRLAALLAGLAPCVAALAAIALLAAPGDALRRAPGIGLLLCAAAGALSALAAWRSAAR